MIRFLLVCWLLTPAGPVFAQEFNFEPVDYTKIEKSIADEASPYYYPRLMERYRQNDTTLTLTDYRYLYLGYTFQPGYSPYGQPEQTDSINQLIARESLAEDDYRQLQALSRQVLEQYPFDIKAVFNMAITCEELGRMEEMRKWFFKFEKIITTILNTGDGLSQETAWHVITVADEYILLDITGLPFGGEQSLLEGGYDYLKLDENEYGIEGVYFNITRMLSTLDLE